MTILTEKIINIHTTSSLRNSWPRGPELRKLATLPVIIMTEPNATFDIYEPSSRLSLSRNTIVISLVAFGFLVSLLPLNIPAMLADYYILATGILSLYFLLTSFLSYRPLNGKIEGKLVFGLGYVAVKDKSYYLSDILQINLYLKDYFGKRSHARRYNFNQLLSQGVNNVLEITDMSNNVQRVFFRLKDKNDYKNLELYLDEYCKHGKISFDRKYELERTELFE